ncbi:hypothetical protein NDU88_003494 [Pleurodeles waltl]|uniref:Uncharacterized protein n=1 Tax=Pleurodeles waltl TaxID=8319 RepID=A0AAV7QC93_PLEWA|nr:hypothetical protein NDU88_003494 [Pleurodeles waltl]
MVTATGWRTRQREYKAARQLSFETLRLRRLRRYGGSAFDLLTFMQKKAPDTRTSDTSISVPGPDLEEATSSEILKALKKASE